MDLDNSQEVHLSHYWNIIYKRWKIAVAILAVVMAGTFLASYLSKPLYLSKVQIQVERENPNQMTVEDLFGIHEGRGLAAASHRRSRLDHTLSNAWSISSMSTKVSGGWTTSVEKLHCMACVTFGRLSIE